MRRVLRVIYNAATILAVGSATATLLLWSRSTLTLDIIKHTAADKSFMSICSYDGKVGLMHVSRPATKPGNEESRELGMFDGWKSHSGANRLYPYCPLDRLNDPGIKREWRRFGFV